MNENDTKLELIRLQHQLLNIFEILENPVKGFKVLVDIGDGYDETYNNSFTLSGQQAELAKKGLQKQLKGRLKELEANYLTILRNEINKV